MAEKMMKTVFDWEHFAVYLSGAMDFAQDGGKGWRELWTERLIALGINSKQIYNPCKKPFHGAQFDLDDEAKLAQDCRSSEDWDGLNKVMSQVMHIDLRLVDKSDIVLVNFPRLPSIPEVEANFDFITNITDIVRIAGPNWEGLFSEYRKLYELYRSLRVPTYGTMHEIVIACQQRKPVFIVWEETGKRDCSAWLMRLVGHRNVFENVDEMIEHLSAISQGQKSFDANEWLLLDPK